jgi:cyclophilin family peptidyl-prolyl cis-trans isomerase
MQKKIVAHHWKICLIAFALVLFNGTKLQAQPAVKLAQKQYVKITTPYGAMVFQLSEATPRHTSNFIKLAKQHYFDTYDFNRVIKGFVAQGGETDSAYAAMEKNGATLERIAPEFNQQLIHQKGALAAGRDDNAEKSSFLGQFYIVDGKKYTDSMLRIAEKRVGTGFKFSAEARKIYQEIGGVPFLDQNYTVFGQLVKGMEVLDQITAQPANKEGLPVKKITISVTVLTKKEIKRLFAAKN